jgi:hypothetical protein
MIYQVTIGDDFDEFKLNYELNSQEPTLIWKSLANETKPRDLRKSLNPWRGVKDSYSSMVVQLNDTIDELNQWIPEKLNSKWNLDKPFESLNNLHIHFPKHEKTEIDSTKKSQLTKFNDLIHGLQVILEARSKNSDLLYLLLCCENKPKNIDIDLEYFKFFKPYFSFGDLTLHYCHVGRHPLEIFLSNDIDCPADQIKPQSEISTYHTLRFFDLENYSTQFKKFYYLSKLSWPYKLEDPRLAFGYINLGKLSNINEKIYSKTEIVNIVKSCNKILDWQFL